jgi:DNA-binding MarR family transcriptional regulator
MHPAIMDIECACATSRQVARVLTQLYDGRLRRSGLEAPQFALLMTLEKQGPSSQSDLGKRYGLDKTTVSRNLKLLERNGWIQSRAAIDKRKRQFGLTAMGRARLAAAKPEWKKIQGELKSAMTPEQWETLFTALRTVAKAAQSLQIEEKQNEATHVPNRADGAQRSGS